MQVVEVKLKNGTVGIVDYIYEQIFYKIIAVSNDENGCTLIISPKEQFHLSIPMNEAVELLSNSKPEILTMLEAAGCDIWQIFQDIIVEYSNLKRYYPQIKTDFWSIIKRHFKNH